MNSNCFAIFLSSILVMSVQISTSMLHVDHSLDSRLLHEFTCQFCVTVVL